MSYNETNNTHGNVVVRDDPLLIIYNVYLTSVFVTVAVGTLLNLWFLVAILRSRDMRSRLRNKIICNSLVIHLVDTTILQPVFLALSLRYFTFDCVLVSVMSNLQLIIDFITNWLLVILIVVFIAQIQDFNPSMKLTPRAVTVCTVGLLVFPWVASLVVVPIIIHEYYHRNEWAQQGCSLSTQDSMVFFKSIDTLTPIVLAVVLVTIAAGLKYRRFNRGYTSGSMQAELISRSPEIDNTFAYVVAVVVSTICDILAAIQSIDESIFTTYGFLTWNKLVIASWILSLSRAVIMPLPWLFLTDVRQHIKTWRPWYRPDLGIGFTLTYRKDET